MYDYAFEPGENIISDGLIQQKKFNKYFIKTNPTKPLVLNQRNLIPLMVLISSKNHQID
jgi:hypothetical protein